MDGKEIVDGWLEHRFTDPGKYLTFEHLCAAIDLAIAQAVEAKDISHKAFKQQVRAAALGNDPDLGLDTLELIAQLRRDRISVSEAVAREREACAAEADERCICDKIGDFPWGPPCPKHDCAVCKTAAAIRARATT